MINSLLSCPRCYGPLESSATEFSCNSCNGYFELEQGIPDLHYTDIPENDGMQPYMWSDYFYFENLLKKNITESMIVVEICSGANYIVPFLLNRLYKNITYISLDNSSYNLHKQKQAVEHFKINSIIADATSLPLRNGSVDIVIGHHAINDIWASRGEIGVKRAIEENKRILKPGGLLVHSHNYNAIDELRHGDISSRMVNLSTVRGQLEDNWCPKSEFGGELEWIIARKPKIKE